MIDPAGDGRMPPAIQIKVHWEGRQMAQKVILVDDLDNSEGSDVIRREFSLLDRAFAIDLSDGNQQRLCDALGFVERILERSREVKQATRSRKAADTAPRLRGYTNTDVREWAREQGLEVSPRGKITDEVVDKFVAAHPDARPEEQDAQDTQDPQDET
jgi:hypothetical protein